MKVFKPLFVADICLRARATLSPMTISRRIVLARHITGAPVAADFRLEDFEPPVLKEGQFRVKNHFVSADPGTRSRLSGTASYAGALPIGAPIDGFAVGEVVETLNEAFPIRQLVTLGAGRGTHTILNGRGYCAKLPLQVGQVPAKRTVAHGVQ
jgi:NADPH-dependent curcumin reductase